MDKVIADLVTSFDAGTLSRRQLIQGLTVLAAAGAAGPAAAQEDAVQVHSDRPHQHPDEQSAALDRVLQQDLRAQSDQRGQGERDLANGRDEDPRVAASQGSRSRCSITSRSRSTASTATRRRRRSRRTGSKPRRISTTASSCAIPRACPCRSWRRDACVVSAASQTLRVRPNRGEIACVCASLRPASCRGRSGRAARGLDWRALEAETLRHFQALVRMDTSDPPGNEQPAAEYLKRVLESEGIPVQIFESEPHRPNVVARLQGQRPQAAAADHGAHRRRERRPDEVDAPAVRRRARRRLRLRPRHGRRQGQRDGRVDDDARCSSAPTCRSTAT